MNKPLTSSSPATLFDQLWARHRVADAGEGADLIAIDRTLLHERTGGVALRTLLASGRAVRDPARAFAIMDHIVSFQAGRGRDESRSPGGEAFITQTRAMAQSTGIHLIDTDDARQGIVHVTAPELGLALPGVSLICPDSHTCSLGALGALAWGVGSSDAEHALVTGVLRVKKPAQQRVTFSGAPAFGVSAKDLALHLIATYGAAGGGRRALEFAGSTVSAMDLEARLTLCNLAVEFAAFTAVIAPDDTVFEAVRETEFAPKGWGWEVALSDWRSLRTHGDAQFAHELHVNAAEVAPQITWGSSPEHGGPIDAPAPLPSEVEPAQRASVEQALAYMAVTPGRPVLGLPVDGVFLGSCTNGRLSDLRAAAAVLRGRRVTSGVRAVCVPGSQSVKAAAEAEGLDQVFTSAGFEWGAPGCAMCFYAGGETFPPGARVVSSTNRNFQGRQGPGVRTHLASPATVAASAVMGAIADARKLAPEQPYEVRAWA